MPNTVKNPRLIIDRKALAAELDRIAEEKPRDAWKAALLSVLKTAYRAGCDEVKSRCDKAARSRSITGRSVVEAQCYLTDQLIRTLYDYTVEHVYRVTNPTESEHMAVVAVGGYGRGELAPFSDIDLLFLLPYKQTPWGEQVVEYMLYMLWDLGLKVGHSTRTADDCIRLAKQDLTIRTALLEARYLWGDRDLFDTLRKRYEKEVIANTGPEYVELKLAERDERHTKLGDSRYVVEPNLKEGKGGLRDLHTLFWIAKYLYRVKDRSELVAKGVFSEDEYREFIKSEDFLWMVRCQLHYLAGRAEERITFDVQQELAKRLGYSNRKASLGVERFMKHYYLVAKNVGDLTRIFCAHLEEQHKRKPKLRLPRLGLRRRKVDGFEADGDWLNVASEKEFKDDPVKMLRLFRVAQQNSLDIHPNALRLVRQNLGLVDRKVQADAEANKLFMDILTAANGTEIALRRLSESGLFGKFVPDFGRVVAQTQHDMYHVYTVDEHTIRAIGLLEKIEAGTLAEDHPLANEIIHKIVSRRSLYVAVLLHDIAKGRAGDHSLLGADIAKKLCPRLGMTAGETETVAWLVRYHLLMSAFAFKRDVSDPKTVSDFAHQVQSPERLRLLLILTVADIRAVGPTIWNGWKGQLLRDLYYRTEEVLMGGHVEEGNKKLVAARKEAVAQGLKSWKPDEAQHHFERFYDSYWLSVETGHQIKDAEMIRGADRNGAPITISFRVDEFRDATVATIYTEDHPGLFARLSGAIAVCGGSIVDAKIFTTKDGMAFDAFWVQDTEGRAFKEQARLRRLETVIKETLKGEILPAKVLSEKPAFAKRTDVFTVEPMVYVDNRASNSYTVIEVNGRDRPGLLYDLARTFFRLNLSISSAHVATYGERAVDVFYVRDLFGHKITHEMKIKAIEKGLLDALSGIAQDAKRAAPRAAAS